MRAGRQETPREEYEETSVTNHGHKTSGSPGTSRKLHTRGRLVVISGPSGAGKSSLVDRLLELPRFCHSTSSTTRARRPQETEGYHYDFIDPDTFQQMVDRNEFLEHATVHGNRYGTLIQTVQTIVDRGDICVLDIDVQGARTLRGQGIDCHFVFVAPPSLEELERRLRTRGTDGEASIQKRLENAVTEIGESKTYDLIVTNIDIEDSVRSVLDFLEARGVSRPGDVPSKPTSEEES